MSFAGTPTNKQKKSMENAFYWDHAGTMTEMMSMMRTTNSTPWESPLTQGQHVALTVIVQLCGALSVIGSIGIIISVLLTPKLRSSLEVLNVLFQAISNLLLGFAYALGETGNYSRGLCVIQAVCIVWFGLSTLLWPCCIATSLLLVVANVNRKVRVVFTAIYHVICWGIPVILCIIMGSSRVLGEADGWCFVKDSLDYPTWTTWVLICFYIPLWVCSAYIIIVYIAIAITLRLHAVRIKNSMDPSMVEQIRLTNRAIILKFFSYPLILVISFTPATLDRITQMAGKPVFALMILHALFGHTIGLTNAIAYGLTQNVWRTIFDCVRGKSRDDLSIASVTSPNDDQLTDRSTQDFNSIQNEKPYYYSDDDLDEVDLRTDPQTRSQGSVSNSHHLPRL